MSLPNTAHVLTTSVDGAKLFPEVLIPEFINKVKGKSSIAKMAAAEPIPFNGMREFTFTMDNEVNVVAENGAKAAGGAQAGVVTIVPIKIEYGARVSDEFINASEEVRLNYLRAFADGWAAKVARGIDIMAMHGVNPRTGSAASGTIGNNHLDYAASTAIEYLDNSSTADENIEAAIAGVEAYDHEVTGMIGGKTIKAALAALKTGTGDATVLYPELKWGGNPGTINGLPVDFNSTVEYNSAVARAYVGDWNMFKWGFAKEMPIEVIRYGNPDNNSDAGDLAGHNQVYLRGEAYIGWGILDPTAFAKIYVGD